MLNTFPNLLFLGLLSPFLIRITVGLMFLWIGYSYLFKDRVTATNQVSNRWPKLAISIVWFGGILEIITGFFLIAGFLTQIAAIAGILIAIDALFVKWLYKDLNKVAKYSKMFYILILVASLSLLFSGAGAFAFDLPL
ncbi:MAG: DoxX family protein [Candidatus Pacebacteria bacterium]|jgi:uncharacterized membrane protein YphA (DoxX/SURF4 family)|nr:hypothetical protein [Parcubacteria group bacterium]MDP6249481.1 DoxX family protein [Candidatus Paceibacterota bacterium]MDP7159223.1 DoxX family protein [Candidatus Paceibacterota bacterium]MDP7367886.1 DoxX family protein [Candidatus Paceibacterota bacterium]MDP7466301.1 DoxX family protein [Candidatus Paceibacterota bacterium]|tara:strand:- start:3314 stop:3727 length:414 start_codon:yes stop_codon:yes gene_type:complete